MPCSPSSRLLTDSLASIVLTVTCLPTSRRKSSTSTPTGPVAVVDEHVRRPSKSTMSASWARIAARFAAERVGVEQVALVRASAGVADHAGGTTDQGDRTMAEVLETTQHEQRHQVADVEAVGGRVETAVERDRRLRRGGFAAPPRRCGPGRGPERGDRRGWRNRFLLSSQSRGYAA